MTDRRNRPSGMPDPVVAPINEGMWRAAAGDQLAVQRCQDCGAHRYPPGDGCYRCSSCRWEWSMLPGTGVVYSYVWIPDRSRAAAGDEAACYNVVVVTLDGTEGEPVRILSNVVNAWGRRDLHVGQTVEVVGVPFADGVALPCFRTVA
jgi:uncharacterized OB-fold protein